MNYPTLSIIIVNYNTKNLLRDCLANLEGKYPQAEIIVIDNNSTDGSAEMVLKEFPQVTIIARPDNKGLAFAYNRGLEKAKGEYILFLGTDAFPQNETITGIVEYLEKNKKVGIATCQLVLRNGELDADAHRGFPTPWAALTHFTKLNRLFPKSKLFNQYFLGEKNLKQPHEIDLCISHFMVVKKKVFDQIGQWDEAYWLYGEDVDLCYRAKQAGWKIMYLPQWKTIHYKGASVGTRKQSADITKADPKTKKRALEASVRGMEIFYKKHYLDKYPKVVTWLVLGGVKLLAKLRTSSFKRNL